MLLEASAAHVYAVVVMVAVNRTGEYRDELCFHPEPGAQNTHLFCNTRSEDKRKVYIWEQCEEYKIIGRKKCDLCCVSLAYILASLLLPPEVSLLVLLGLPPALPAPQELTPSLSWMQFFLG